MKDDFAHRTLVLFEAVALREEREKTESNLTAYIVRSLLSEGEIRYPVTMRGPDGSSSPRRSSRRARPTSSSRPRRPACTGRTRPGCCRCPPTTARRRPPDHEGHRRRSAATEARLHRVARLRPWLAAGNRQGVIPYARCPRRTSRPSPSGCAATSGPCCASSRPTRSCTSSAARPTRGPHRRHRGRLPGDPRPDRRPDLRGGRHDRPADDAGDRPGGSEARSRPRRNGPRRRVLPSASRGPRRSADSRQPGSAATWSTRRISAASRARYRIGNPLPEEQIVLPARVCGAQCAPPCTHSATEPQVRAWCAGVRLLQRGISAPSAAPCAASRSTRPSSPWGSPPRRGRGRPVTRETTAAKASRYLAEGRLIVTSVDGDHVTAACGGSGEVYQLGHQPGRGWWCSCPVRTDRCAHLQALQLVTIRTATTTTRRTA